MNTLRNMIVSYLIQSTWDKYLRHLRFAYNTSWHPAFNDVPFISPMDADANTPIDTIHPKLLHIFTSGNSYKAELSNDSKSI